MKYKHLAFALTTPFFVNACFEVEDNTTPDNADLVAALTTQNQILTEQNAILTEQANAVDESPSVTMRGRIYDLNSSDTITTAAITAKIGGQEMTDAVSISEGIFEITGLPADSDIEIIVTDESDTYMSRVFYLETGNANSDVSFKDVGGLGLSKPLTVEFAVLDEITLQPFAELEFTANSNYGNGATSQQYNHVSEYDEASGMYTMQIPANISLYVMATLDLDGDGEGDIAAKLENGQQYEDDIVFTTGSFKDLEVIYVQTPETGYETLTVNVAVVNENFENVSGLEIVVDDDQNDNVSAQYDEETGSYQLTFNFDGDVYIEIPAFSDGETSFESSTVRVKDDYYNPALLDIIFTNANLYDTNYEVPKDEEINVVVRPYVGSESDINLETVLARMDEETGEYSVFYSVPVEIAADQVTFTNRSGFEVIEGSASDDDLVLPGTTVFDESYDSVPFTITSSLNGTKYTFTPDEELVAGDNYLYEIHELTILASGESIQRSNDDESFTAKTNATFSIEDIRLDNNDYHNEGVLITPQNTAGEASTATPLDTRVYIYLPKSIDNLKYLALQQELVVEDGVSRTDRAFYQIVTETRNYATLVGLHALAKNETIIDEYSPRTIIYGSAQPNTQSIYYYSNWEYLPDNTADSENTITFSYAYETQEGEVFNGTVTLPVQ